MKHFGTVQSFNETTGHGFIRPEEGGKDLRFERCEIASAPGFDAHRSGKSLANELCVD